MTIETFAESAEQIKAASVSGVMSGTAGTFSGYLQVLCSGCGHGEHPGATCIAYFDATASPCRCIMPATLQPQITLGYFGSKQPFKCPVCVGSGRTYWPASTDTSGVACQACNGSGVVWGPP